MEIRYQVFVSSTYADLQEERQEIMQALLELDSIPAGMELFPAANEDQWTLIKKVIDDCDYYIVILAGRYGSIGAEGLSYTEMEYRYALESGKPVMAFVHKNPDSLAVSRCEATQEGKDKLKAFRGLVQQKMCRFWDSPADLGSQVSRSLVKLIKAHPGVGWVRGNLVPDKSSAEEILSLKTRIEVLQKELREVRTKAPEGTGGLAQGSDTFRLHYTFVASLDRWKHNGQSYRSAIDLPWDMIFAGVAPIMIHEAPESQLKHAIDQIIPKHAQKDLANNRALLGMNLIEFHVTNEDFQTIKIQLRALGLISMSNKSRSVKDTEAYWTLTPYGDTVMTRLRGIPRDSRNEERPVEGPQKLSNAGEA